MPSKESLAHALPMVCKRLQWSEETPSAFVMGWANAVADLLDEAIREARIDEHNATCHKALVELDEKGRYAKTLRCGKGWTCERLAQLREGKP